MVDNKYLREYAEKAYLQYPGYSLEKARINFPKYYPAIASYYLQLKTKELEMESLNNRNALGIPFAVKIVDQLKRIESKFELLNRMLSNRLLSNRNSSDPKQQAFKQFVNKTAVPLIAASFIKALEMIEKDLSKTRYLGKSFRSRLELKQLTDKFVEQIKLLDQLTKI